MCGRYALTVEPEVLAALFALETIPVLDPRFNIAPSQSVPVVACAEVRDQRALRTMRWGLVPSWAKDSKIGYRTINARSETAHEKPSFRSAFRKRRCLVPASWFYEWRRDGAQKTPFRVRRADGAPLAMAGLWEHWKGSESEPARTTFTVLTTRANGDVAELHERMPCLIGPADFDRWLSPEVEDAPATAALLAPAAEGTLVLDRVSRQLNHVKNEGPSLLTPDTLF